MGQVWLIASGKGGVGKTTFTSALGCALADNGKKVCIVDADTGLRDQDAILGVENQVVYDTLDVAERNCGLQQALITLRSRPSLQLLPAAQFARVKDVSQKRFRNMITRLKAANDYVLIDCPAGLERGVRTVLNCDVDMACVITTPDDLCIRNAERMLSVLRESDIPAKLVVNRLQPDLIRNEAMYHAKTVAQVLETELFGEIPEDSEVYRTLLSHTSLIDTTCAAADAIRRIARRICGETVALPDFGSEPLPWYKRIFRRKEAKHRS